MFFKVLAAIVTADAFDRHMREQQHRAWAAEAAAPHGRTPAASRAPLGTQANDAPAWDLQRPERPTSPSS
jgi:hypothetical protein